MRTGDLFGDLGQGRIIRPGVLEPIFRYRHGVSTAMPFADKPRAWLQAQARRRPNSARPQVLRNRLQLAAGRSAEAAVLEFLNPVAERKHKQVTADLWRLAVVKPLPVETQFCKAE
jgi:hypothetical protein